MEELSTLQSILEKPVGFQLPLQDVMILEEPLVNVFLVGSPTNNNREWVLIGTGMAHTAKDIVKAAEGRFGKGTQPKAIILSHGHFDHVGSILELLDIWNVPVYAHQLELPFLTGKMDYPPADPTVDEGLIAKISPTFPNKSINLGNRVKALPTDGSVPGMTGWRWLHTPGHSPGHVSFFREQDRTLIVGDAFTTLKQSSANAVLSKEKELNGPPAYFTTDWKAAENSVKVLQGLNPRIAISSHGRPMEGEELTQQLNNLVQNFKNIARPKQGRYLN